MRGSGRDWRRAYVCSASATRHKSPLTPGIVDGWNAERVSSMDTKVRVCSNVAVAALAPPSTSICMDCRLPSRSDGIHSQTCLSASSGCMCSVTVGALSCGIHATSLLKSSSVSVWPELTCAPPARSARCRGEERTPAARPASKRASCGIGCTERLRRASTGIMIPLVAADKRRPRAPWQRRRPHHCCRAPMRCA